LDDSKQEGVALVGAVKDISQVPDLGVMSVKLLKEDAADMVDQKEVEDRIKANPKQMDVPKYYLDVNIIESNVPIQAIDTRSRRARSWTSLDSIVVRNFKAIKEAVIPLGQVTILVGPNGSGKSSVLQAIHWAARAASYIAPKNTKEMISFERLDYLPSSEPLRTAHKSELKTDTASDPVEVVFVHATTGEERTQVSVKIRAARNRGGITVYMDGGTAVTPYKQRFQFITAYIPGLAGLSERESILAQPSLRRQAASGDAGGVMRNILLNLCSRRGEEVDENKAQDRLRRLNSYIEKIHPGTNVNVTFDEREDYHIYANYSSPGLGNLNRPLETAATGLLQVVQIFAYLILFEPKIMLIDEPDAHLHPDKQENLIETLEMAAAETDTQIILTTHSPHVTRGASPSVQLVWMNNGEVQTDDGEAIRRLLGWGGLGKSVLFFVEDEDDTALRVILRQWPELSRQLAVCRCFGIDNLPKDRLLSGILGDAGLNMKIIIHRDGDFMSGQEPDMWSSRYKTENVFPWVTAGSDIEYYFCTAEYLSRLYGVDINTAETWRADAASKVSKARDTFLSKRIQINRELYPNGGSPNSNDLWSAAGGPAAGTVKGKKLLAALKTVIKSNGYNEKKLDCYTIPDGITIAEDLHDLIKRVLILKNSV
jgi:ABC-type cobalamin/Fe3+-siderophores transport system ATPase subunit